LEDLLASVEAEGKTEILAFRSNVDYSGSLSTWGCHESYLHREPAEKLQPHLIPHLVTRVIYTGAGGFHPLAPGLEFTLSPRAAHIQHIVSGNSTADRGLWHTKEEPLSARYRRLHLICGESLCSETAAFLKIGVTALVVAMADAGLAPGAAVQFADSLESLHAVAGDVTCKRPLAMADGSRRSAIEIQRHYLRLAEQNLDRAFMPSWAGEVCRRWRVLLDQLEDAPRSVERTLDWAIKRTLYANHAARAGFRWDALPFWSQMIDKLLAACKSNGRRVSLKTALGPKSPVPDEIAALDPLVRTQGLEWQDLKRLLDWRSQLFAIDMRFGQLRGKGIFDALDGVLNHKVDGVENIEQALTEPPATGRARLRGKVIRELAGTENARCDWQTVVNFDEQKVLHLSDPFVTEEKWGPWSQRLPREMVQAFEIHAMSHAHGRRQVAADCVARGDYARAEELLRGLALEGFEMPSTHCHLARVFVLTNRGEEAREQVRLAWAIRQQADPPILARILFLQCVFAMLDGNAFTEFVEQLKEVLSGGRAHLDWRIQPVVMRVRTRVGEPNYQFLKALAAALCDASDLAGLERYPQWRDAAVPEAVAIPDEDIPF